eukprot:s2709_g6.t1
MLSVFLAYMFTTSLASIFPTEIACLQVRPKSDSSSVAQALSLSSSDDESSGTSSSSLWRSVSLNPALGLAWAQKERGEGHITSSAVRLKMARSQEEPRAFWRGARGVRKAELVSRHLSADFVDQHYEAA